MSVENVLANISREEDVSKPSCPPALMIVQRITVCFVIGFAVLKYYIFEARLKYGDVV